jgi:Neuraminidase (sialidase)
MRFEKISEGFVRQNEAEEDGLISAGPRSALARDGAELLCTYALTKELGTNDFVAVLSRSSDGGQTWSHEGPVFSTWRSQYSIAGSICRAPSGEHYFHAMRTPIDVPGETFWNDATSGMKQNDLVWTRSQDDGRTWQEPSVVPMHAPGSAEAPGALCVKRNGDLLLPYAPYNSFELTDVERNHVVVARSSDGGRSWSHTSMLRFEEGCSGAEAWVVELADGRLLGTSWLTSIAGEDYPNAYAMSGDGGQTWSPTGSTATMGQSTALTPLSDGRVLFLYNDRKGDLPGVRMVVCRPTETDFGVEHDDLVWAASKPTQSDSSKGHLEWTDFAFGEPSATVLADGTVFVALWSHQPGASGIPYVMVKLVP